MTKTNRRMVLLVVGGIGVVLVADWQIRRAVAEGAPSTAPVYFAGTLTEGGTPVNGTRDVVLRLFDVPTGGSETCTTTTRGTTFTAGRFRVALDATCVADVRENPDRWVEVQVGSTILARTKIGAVPYALEADRASALAVAARREMMGVGEVWNCRLAYDSPSGTLSVVARDGSPLSPAHPCFVGVGDGRWPTSSPCLGVLANDANTFGSTAEGRGQRRLFFLAACDGSIPGRRPDRRPGTATSSCSPAPAAL